MAIKLLILIDTLGRGGRERQVVEFVRSVNKKKLEIYIIFFSKEENDFYNEIKIYCKEVLYLKRKFRWDISIIKFLINYSKLKKINLIFALDYMSVFYSLFTSYFTSIKFINGSIRDTDKRFNIKLLLKRIFLKLSPYVLANSYEGLKIYKVTKKGVVIYNGIDLRRFNKEKKRINNNFVIGMIANLTEYKDYYTFFNAIKILQDKINNLEVHIIGDGKLRDVYKKYAVDIGINQNILKYFGRVSNVEDFIPNFDVGVLCSYKEKGEGLSNSVIEYMACCVPPIITDIGAAREIIDDGVTGLLFEAGKPEELANKILLLYNDENLRLRLGNNAKESVLKKFDYDRYIKEMENYIIEVFNSK